METINKFYRKVGRRRIDMIQFLRNHFRYFTMHSWNGSTSYANNVKIDRVVPETLQSRAWELYKQGEVFNSINEKIRAWGEPSNFQWQAAFNGKSGGYLVLYKGVRRELDYHTKCTACGRLTWYETEQDCHVAGCRGYLQKLDRSAIDISIYPGKGVDMNAYYEDWDTYSLKERVKLVSSFDRLCDTVVSTFVTFCKTYTVIDEVVHVPKVIKVLMKQ